MDLITELTYDFEQSLVNNLNEATDIVCLNRYKNFSRKP